MDLTIKEKILAKVNSLMYHSNAGTFSLLLQNAAQIFA